MTGVAEVVYCSLIGRHRAGTRPAPTVVARGVRTPVADSTVPIVHDRRAYEGGRCGGNPPAQGRTEGPTAQRQRLGVMGQDLRRLRWLGAGLGFGSVVAGGLRKFTPIMDCVRRVGPGQ